MRRIVGVISGFKLFDDERVHSREVGPVGQVVERPVLPGSGNIASRCVEVQDQW